jgi:hypothetical protein
MAGLCAPLFLGALAGSCMPSRPVLAAVLSVPVATTALTLGEGLSPGWILLALPFLMVWALPTAILGAICARTTRRWLLGQAP